MKKAYTFESFEMISQKYSHEIEIMNDQYKKVIYFLMKQGLSYEDAQDAAQDAYVEAVSCLPTLRQTDSLISWLFTIVSRTGKRYLSKKIKKRDNEVAIEEFEDRRSLEMSVSDEDIIEDVLGVSKKEVLRKSLMKLGDVERKVLIMYYNYEYDYKVIATRLNIKHSTVRSISKRAKEKLRRIIIEEEINNMN